MKHMAATFAVATLAFASWSAHAETIDFEDLGLPAGPSSIAWVRNGYHGLNWSNFAALNTDGYDGNPSGYQVGAVSGTHVAFNSGASPASFWAATPFVFESVYLTAAWNDSLSVTITGSRNGVVVHEQTVFPLATAATLYTLNWSGIDSVMFRSSGGTDHAAYPGSGAHIGFDNLSVSGVPEPSAALMMLLGVGALAHRGLRRPSRAR